MQEPLLDRYRDEILRVASKHGASRVRVFGSRARRESDQSSDLDILIALEEGRTLLDLVRLKRELEELTHRPVDVVTESSLSPHMRDQILADAVQL
jgi:predicted nucleotidyltransferase